MAKKKTAPKSKPANDTSNTKDTPKNRKLKADDKVVLYIPSTLYQQYLDLGKDGKQEALRDLFHMVSAGDDRRYGVLHCKVRAIENLRENAKDSEANDDDGREPVKLCDEGGR